MNFNNAVVPLPGAGLVMVHLFGHKQSLIHRPKQPMADVTDSVMGEGDEGDFEEVGFDYLLKPAHSCLQAEGNTDLGHPSSFFYLSFVAWLRFGASISTASC